MRFADVLHKYRRWLIALAIILGLSLLAAILILTFGWTYLRQPLETQLSRQVGRPVTIAHLRRVDHGFLYPVLEAQDVRMAQPDWVGGGDMMTVRRARVRLPLLPLLAGQAKPQSIELDGVRIALVRRDSEHANWKGFPSGRGGGGGALPPVTIRDGQLTLNDAKRDHRFTARLEADTQRFQIAGRGSLAGHPSTIRLVGAPIAGSGPWPFRLDYRSAITGGTLLGRADHPLDIGHFSARATAWADDLAHLDLLIEAGLPGTQPARLTADIRQDRPDWTIRTLKLKLGRSDFAGDITIRKRDGRSLLDGAVLSQALDFNDLASDAGLARAAAKRRAAGPRVIPDTAIDLRRLRKTDATVRFDVRRLLMDRPSMVKRLTGTLSLDHGVLKADPLTVHLSNGRIFGVAKVDHREGRPLLTVDLRLTGGRLEELVPTPDHATGSVRGRVLLAGHGETIRAAMGVASGRAALVAEGGMLSRRNALILGTDAGRALFEDKDNRTPLNCVIAGFVARNGIAQPAPLVIDTSVSRVDGAGTLNLATEQLALSVRGRPKLKHATAIDLPVGITGTLFEPQIVPPKIHKTVGTAFKLLGRMIRDRPAERAPDTDCHALAARVLR